MTIPFPPTGAPDQTVNQDAGAQLSQGMQVLVTSVRGLERVIATQTAMMERTLSASSRYQMGGQRQFRQDVLQEVAGAGASLHGARTTQVTPLGATSSLQNLQSFAAQRIGQWIAGIPLYEQPGGGPSAPSGGTPVGTPSSQTMGGPVGTPVPSGSQGGGSSGGSPGAAPAAAPAGPPPGRGPSATPPPATVQQPAGTGLSGLPGFLYGGQNAAAPPRRTTAALRQVGARVAMSSGSLSGIMGVLKDLPGVGLLTDLAQGGADFYLNQREAGRVYQETEGGSNLAAQAERWHALAYEASMFGRMPAGAAASAFGQVTAMGYNRASAGAEATQGQNRQSALDFIYHNYTAYGMDVQQSVSILQTASQNAVNNLNTVSEALKTVSDTAGQAGTNANVMRQYFNQYFQQAQQLGAGAGSPILAGALASMQGSMGKEFAGVNFGGELSQARQYLLSGMSGVSPAQLQYTARNNPQQYARLLAGQNLQFLTAGGLMTPEMTSSLHQMIAAAGGGTALLSNPGLRDQIAQQFLNEWQVKGNINENVWAQEISMLTGVKMNPDQAFQWIVSQSAGVNEASHNSAFSAPTGRAVRPAPGGSTGSAPRGQFGLAQGHLVTAPGRASALVPPHYQTWRDVLTQGAAGAAAQNYLKFDTAHGHTRSPVLEALLQNASGSDQVKVMTKTGPRVMPLSLAMKYYPQELAGGNVEFYSSSGQQLGDTAMITHGLVNNNANTAEEMRQATGSRQGLSLSKFNAAHPGSTTVPAGGGHAVTVDLSNAAQQLLKLLPNNYDQAAATSQVPANPWPSQASR